MGSPSLPRLLIIFAGALAPGCLGVESPILPRDFWGSGRDNDIPARFESVCTPDADRCGDTHFSINGDECSLDYERFDSDDAALAKWRKIDSSASKRIRIEKISDENGHAVGVKSLLVDESGKYQLVWERFQRFTRLSCTRLSSLELYEKDRRIF